MGKNHKKIIIAASGAVAMALSLCACQVGGSTSAPAESKAASDTITMMNYPDWIGENEASAFKDETGYTLKQVSTPDGGDSAWGQHHSSEFRLLRYEPCRHESRRNA